MQDLYATTFGLSAGIGDDCLGIAATRTEHWLAERLQVPVSLHELGDGTVAGAWDATLRWAHRRDFSGDREAIDAVFEHADRGGSPHRWRTAIVLTRSGATCRATVRLSRGATRHELRPQRFQVAPPQIVAALLEPPLRGYAGHLELSTRAARLHAEDVRGFISDILRNPGRALPVVVCDVGSTLPDSPDDIAHRFVGLAHVVILHSSEAWERLRHELPHHYVPYGGAWLYWPGFGLQGDDIRHRYYTRADLRQRSLVRRLGRFLRDLAVSQVPRDRLPDRLRVEALRRPSPPAPEIGADAERITKLERQVEGFNEALEELERAWDQNEELEAANKDLALSLERTLANLEVMSRYGERAVAEDDEHETPALEEPTEFGTRFVEALDELSSPAMAFTDRARACAARNDYRRPADMYSALIKLEEIARLYHSGSLGGRIVDVAKRHNGLNLALQDSGYHDTMFVFEDQRLDRLPHVKIDDGVPPSEVGRIYFALDADNNRIVVDWFGIKNQRPT